MMRRIAPVFAFAMLGACEDDDFECSLQDRNGSYLFSYVELSGNCGPIGAAVGRIDNSAPVMGCTLEVADVVSEDACKLERTIICEAPSLGAGFTTKTVAVSEQQDENAELITGTFSIFVRDAAGVQVCGSTYDVEAERQ